MSNTNHNINKVICCIYIVAVCLFTSQSPATDFASGTGEPNDLIEQAVTIELTKFDVNETKLKLQWKIKNDSDHDVWICASVFEHTGTDFEAYTDNDTQTLVVRRRLDVPATIMWDVHPYGKYIRLSPGEKRIESVSLSLPVRLRRVYMESQGKKAD